MGLLRFYLAMVVVIGHAHPSYLKFIPLNGNGALAIQAFFIISGFYMSLLLEKYRLQETTGHAHTINFYLSRFFRIYPLYAICISVALLLNHFNFFNILHPPNEVLQDLHSKADIFLYGFSNIFIFGQDIMRFMVFNPVTHHFNLNPLTDFINGNLLGSGYQIMGQTWTLAIELTFYLLAPFILTRKQSLIISLCLMSFLLKYAIYKLGFKSYNISVAFFPTTLGYFLLGNLTYTYIYKRFSSGTKLKLMAWLSLACILLFANYFFIIGRHTHFKEIFFILLVTISVPFLFANFKNSKLDNFIGELSYPVYMVHFFAFAFVAHFFHTSKPVYLIILFTTLFSVIITLYYLRPLDRWRHKKFIAPREQNRYEIHDFTVHAK